MNRKRSRNESRANACSKLDVDGRRDSWDENMYLLEYITKTCPAADDNGDGANPLNVKVVNVSNGWDIPLPFAKITNSILFLNSSLEPGWSTIANLLNENEHLIIYAFMLILNTRTNKFLTDPPLDWNRIRASVLIIDGYGDGPDFYNQLYKDVKKSRANIYHAISEFFPPRLKWHADDHNNFVLMEDLPLQRALAELGPNSTVIHLGTLNANRVSWTAQALAELQKSDRKRRKTKDKKKTDVESVGGMRQKLTEALSGSIQNPNVKKQLYHDFKGNEWTTNEWLDFLLFLQKEHPRFCPFRGDMFVYDDTTKKFDEHPDLFETIQFCNIQRRFIVGILHIITANGSHANALIIDRQDGSLSRFEPHGSATRTYTSLDLDAHLQDFVHRNEDKGLSVYVPPREFCARVGPQAKADNKQYRDFDERKMDYTDRGWCAAISLMFIHYRLAHPETSLKDVEEMMSSKSGGQLAFEIRSYANHVVQEMIQGDRMQLFTLNFDTDDDEENQLFTRLGLNG